jgi:hypothetical protein
MRPIAMSLNINNFAADRKKKSQVGRNNPQKINLRSLERLTYGTHLPTMSSALTRQ